MTDVARHPNGPRRTRRWAWGVVLATMVMLIGCGKRIPGPASATTTLHVENQGYFDVNVFVMRSPLTRGVRLGTVNGSSSRTFRVRMTDLQPGGQLVLLVRAISGRTAWTSPSLTVDIGTVARLDVISSSSGDLSRSQLYRQ